VTRAFALTFEVRRGDLRKLTEKLINLSVSFPYAFRAALFEEATIILAHAKAYAPYKTGQLYRSGRAYTSSDKDPKINVQFLAPYALAVHERHRTKGKFLERAVNEALGGMARRIAKRIAEIA